MYEIWKKQAMNELEMYAARKVAAEENIPDQIKELESQFSGIRSPAAGGVSVRGGGGRKDEQYLDNIVARDLLKENLKAAKRSIRRVEAALGALSKEEREILERFYIKQEKEAAFNMADELNVDRKTVYCRKDAALKKFATAMYNGV